MNATTTTTTTPREYLAAGMTSPWFLAVVVDAAGSADPAFAAGRHVYCRTRAGLVDVRGEGGVYVRVTVRQAAERLRRCMGPDGRPLRVSRQERWNEECGEYWSQRQALRGPRNAA